ncbi:hypothetical protein QAD02_014809 [Eretmocerus hayati]|uniref:Uncharacterized protein n=1 Tax=Eretmocerus hayati TaxID=131215 RepID=A0ACC2P6H9_9HYME|nr:hypothetical protein QAD02_014809 [Eretmocerus hayati]
MLLSKGMRRGAVVLLLPLLAASCTSQSFKSAKFRHESKILNSSQIKTLADLTDETHMNEVLDNICIPRVVGTPGHDKVKEYIKSSLKGLGWSVETDTFSDRTPLGTRTFENIVAKWNPKAPRFLTLACHYDSKYERDYEFIGATDSAVPCMQLINLAKVMRDQLESIKDNDVNLMLLFFDGEEAFHIWGPDDSIYGARHLAAKWGKTNYKIGAENVSDLDRIDLLVLLDLIGAPNPKFYNFFSKSSRWHMEMLRAETSLANMGELSSDNYGSTRSRYFQNKNQRSYIEDDHIPFLQRDVPILHVIPSPFPDSWHTPEDNRATISMSTIENLNKIFRVFVASYLNMEV